MNEIKLIDGTLTPELSQEIADLEKSYKDLEAKEKELKAKLKEVMQASGVVKVDNDIIRITYIPETDAEGFDKKALKEELPDIYDAYCTISKRAAYVKVEVKNG